MYQIGLVRLRFNQIQKTSILTLQEGVIFAERRFKAYKTLTHTGIWVYENASMRCNVDQPDRVRSNTIKRREKVFKVRDPVFGISRE